MTHGNAENTAKEQRLPKRQGFVKGQSGNPSGRPKGSRNKATLAAQALLEGESEALTRKAKEMALAGDVTAMRLCLERILPPRRDTLITFDLPEIRSADDVMPAQSAILGQVACGDLTPTEGSVLCGMVENIRKGYEFENLERRLAALEKEKGQNA